MSTQPVIDSLNECYTPVDYAMPWGRFHPIRLKIDYNIDLTQNSFTVGRARECDYTIIEEQMDSEMYPHVSNFQFKIERKEVKENVIITVLEDLSSNGTFCNGELVGKGKHIVLKDNDSIAIAKKTYNEKCSNSVEFPKEIENLYLIKNLLGRGGYGEVRLAIKKDNVQNVAIKKIVTEVLEKNRVVDVLTEIKVLKRMDHDNIVKFVNATILDKEIYLILEYMPGGDFSHFILNREKLSEEQTKFIFYQILRGVYYLHRNKIIHRDLKPANILLGDESDYPKIKIADFGLSKIMENHCALVHTKCGTKNFSAPELQFTKISRTYDYRVDVWSVGVMLYVSLSGLLPFRSDRSDLTLEQQISSANYSFEPKDVWLNISLNAKLIIKKCLVRNPQKRCHIHDILMDDWIVKDQKLRYQLSKYFKNNKENTGETAAKKLRTY